MNKLNKILLVIIVILLLVLGVMSYYCVFFKNALLESNKQMTYTLRAIDEAGFKITNLDDGYTQKLIEK